MRSKSDRAAAVATGTLVVQFCDWLSTPVAFECAIDDTQVLRRTGPAASRTSGAVTELRCEVEYGPVFGAYESDLRRQLKALASNSDRLTGNAIACEVFNFSRREVTAADLDTLAARAEDPTLTLSARKRLSDAVRRLRERDENERAPREAE